MGADLERLAFAIFASDFHSPEDLEEARPAPIGSQTGH